MPGARRTEERAGKHARTVPNLDAGVSEGAVDACDNDCPLPWAGWSRAIQAADSARRAAGPRTRVARSPRAAACS